MKIIVNGEAKMTEAQTLQELLLEIGMSRAKVATALNENFVPTGQRAAQVLSEGDRVEIVSPRQGG